MSVGGPACKIHSSNGASDLPGILGFGYAWRADGWMFSLLERRPWNSVIYFSGIIVGSILGTALLYIVKLRLTNSVIDEYLTSYCARY